MQASDDIQIEIVDTFSHIPPQDWDALTDGTPLLKHAFFASLEDSKSIGLESGWQPQPLLVKQGNQLLGAMPLFLKTHSYGEYVFDWSWADAYAQHGLAYYPKLLSAIPFSPVTSMRLLSGDAQVRQLMLSALEAVMQQYALSSAHVLFPDTDAADFEAAGWLKRQGVQFCWHNKRYKDFEDFLGHLTHDKRKKIRQERRKISEAGIVCKWMKGADITESDWDFFYQCYCSTYRQHHSTPYLSREFFSLIGQRMPQHIVLMMAELDGQPIASALNLYHQHRLYGRYWGAMRYVPGLHYELCYYQAQMFCMAENIDFFEGGAQGEHKLARGFEARPTCSFHKIADPEFSKAIAAFVRREAQGVAAYTDELEARAPFKAGEK